MNERDDYIKLSRRLRDFLEEDRIIGPTVPGRRRVVMLNRAVNLTEAGISRLDPLFSEVWARFADVLLAARPKSGRLRRLVVTAINQAGETHGPDDPLMTRLRTVRSQAGARAGKPNERKLARAQEDMARLREDPGSTRLWVVAMDKLAQLYLDAGRYDEMIDTYDRLMGERTRLGLEEEQLAFVERFVGDTLFQQGEAARAAPLLAAVTARNDRRRRPDASLDDTIDDTNVDLSLALCHLALKQPREAEAVLREAMRRLRRHDDSMRKRFFHRLRHRTTYELGSALWKLGRAGEAAPCFEEAHRLVAGPRYVDRKFVTPYRNALTYIELR
ncbi:tetratricopeptide repeat protein [Nonomuraea sp. B19D2]|uniref:tetratricopeptide repeat protein n=1 Tax=Nonomuraea sp. B19D2 TaxID=3159561 RepID=UPI0032DB86AE